MSVRIEFIWGPLPPAAPDQVGEAGAIVQFEGVVRPSENGRGIDTLEYEAYRPMADDMLRTLAEGVQEQFGLSMVAVEHSIGSVGVGQRSFRLVIAAEHRAPALRAMSLFIDRMKRDVPIWKRPVFADTPGAHA